MADGGWISANGLEKAISAVQSLDQKVQKTIIRKGLREGAKPILSAVKSEVPVRTGFLASTIKISSGGGRKGTFWVKVGSKVGTWKKQGKAFYADFVEYGHRVGKSGFVQGRHYMARSVSSAGQAAVQKAADSWWQQIREAWAGQWQ